MIEEQIEGWIKIYETYDYMLAELIEAKLHDNNIEYQVMNKSDIGYTMEVGNNIMGREATGRPFKFFVKPADIENATKLINEDKSSMMDDPNLDFDE
jgi:hypothetical protein